MTVGRVVCERSNFRLLRNNHTIEPLADIFGKDTAPFRSLTGEFRHRVVEEAAAADIAARFARPHHAEQLLLAIGRYSVEHESGRRRSCVAPVEPGRDIRGSPSAGSGPACQPFDVGRRARQSAPGGCGSVTMVPGGVGGAPEHASLGRRRLPHGGSRSRDHVPRRVGRFHDSDCCRCGHPCQGTQAEILIVRRERHQQRPHNKGCEGIKRVERRRS